MKTFSILLLCTGLFLQTVQAQNSNALNAYETGRKHQEKGRYHRAILSYNIAIEMGMPTTGDSDVNTRIAYCAEALDKLRIDSDTAKNRAVRATKLAEKQKGEIDSLYKKQESTLSALKIANKRAKEMQEKMETAMMDKAIKDHFNDWKGFAKYSLKDTETDSTQNKILNQVDSLDLSDNALLSIPKEVVRCPNLKYLNLFGNSDIDWKASEKTLKQLKDNVGIYISVNDLSEIDSSYWHFITGVEIISDTLKHIPQNILQQKQLKCLILEQNELKFLPPEIGSLTNLNRLSLYGNNIGIIPSELGELINLTQLDLRYNNLVDLSPEIGRLRNLTEIYLDWNSLNTLPVEIGVLENLTTLSLTNNDLSILPKEIGELKNLSYLNLYKNKLVTLPSEIGSLINLAYLSLYDNNLLSLPDGIWKLNKLSLLDLRENNLYFLSRKIGNLTNLTTLGLRSNGLETLPEEIGKLTKLSVLSLEGNNLSKKKSKLQGITNLSTLYIDVDFAEMNSEEIANMKKLKSLYLYGNEFSNILNEIKELESLTTLNLIGYTSVPLLTIPAEISGLANLTTLYIIGDSLNSIPVEISGLGNLIKLDLNIRKMSQLPTEIGTLNHLRHLDLRDTPIKSIPDELFNLNLTSNDFFKIGQKLYSSKNYRQALKSYFRCLEIDSTNIHAYGNIGLCYRMQGKLEEALLYLKKFLSFDENYTWCLNQLSYTYAAMNNFVKAFEYAEKSNKIKLSADVWSETGNQLSSIKKYEQALKSYLRSIDIDSTETNATIYGNLGSCYGKLGNPTKAVEYYNIAYTKTKKLILIDSTNYNNWFNLSFYCSFVNKYPEGIRAALKSLELAEKNESVYTNLALNYVLNNQYNEKAKPLYEKWKDIKFHDDDRLPKVMFLQDIKDLEDANITHPDFEKVRELFKE